MQATATTTDTTQRLQQLLPELFEPPQQSGDRYLRFQLTAERTAALPLASIREAMQVAAARVTLLPNLPDCALGLVNAFNQVFCAIDLAQLCGVGLLDGTPRQYTLVAIRAIAAETSRRVSVAEDEPVLGLAVHRIQGVVSVLPETITAAPRDLPASLVPFVRGASGDDLLLDTDAIVAAPALTAL